MCSVRSWCWRHGAAWGTLTATSANSTKRSGCSAAFPCFSRYRCRLSNTSLAVWNQSTCPAGQAVFHQGDPADRFYVIETGAADVVWDGHLITTLGPGDGFGEIALLRRVRRTATVQAATDLELQALTCDRFLPVVTGFPPSSREARAEVEEMLDRFDPDEHTDDQNGPRH